MNRILFIGGPGNISRHTLEAAKAFAGALAVFTLPSVAARQKDREVRFFPGDRDDTRSLRKALREFRPDIIADFVCFTPGQAEKLYRIVRGDIEQLLFVSTSDVYGYPLSHIPMDEEDPRRDPLGEYARNKRACEDFYHGKAEQENFPLTVVRPTYSFGRDFLISFLSFRAEGVLSRLKAGLPVFVPGDGTTLLQAGPAENTGRMIAAILEHPEITTGKDYTVGYPDPMSHDDYVRMLAGAMKTDPVIRHIPADFVYRFFPKETKNSMLHVLTRFNVFFSLKAFRTDFPQFRWTKRTEGSISDYLEEHPVDGGPGDTFEDKLVSLWDKMISMIRNND